MKYKFACFNFLLLLLLQNCNPGRVYLEDKYAGIVQDKGLFSLSSTEGDGSRKLIADFLDNTANSQALAELEGRGSTILKFKNQSGVFFDDHMVAFNSGSFGGFGVAIQHTTNRIQNIDGSPLPLKSWAKVAGIYNYVFKNKSETSYGTLRINADKTWQYWIKENGANSTNTQGHLSGTFSEKQDNIFEAIVTAVAPTTSALLNGRKITPNSKFGHFILARSSKSMSRLILDAKALDGFAVGAPQAQLNQGDYDAPYVGVSTNKETEFAIDIKGSEANAENTKMTLQYNKPWNGFVSDGAQFNAILYYDQPKADTQGMIFLGLNKDTLFVGASTFRK